MTLIRPLYMQAVAGDDGFDVSALEHRSFVQAALGEGVIGAGDYAVSPRSNGANFTVDIAPGMAVVYGDSIAAQGGYVLRSTAVENRPIPAAPASGQRVHRVVLRVRDRSADGTVPAGTYDQVIEVLADTGGGTPPQPDSAITLALVTVTAATGSITASNISSRRSLARLPVADLLLSTPGLAGETSANLSIGLAPILTVPDLPYAAVHVIQPGHAITQSVPGDEFRAFIRNLTAGVDLRGQISKGVEKWTFNTPVTNRAPANSGAMAYQPTLYREAGTGIASFTGDARFSAYSILVRPVQ